MLIVAVIVTVAVGVTVKVISGVTVGVIYVNETLSTQPASKPAKPDPFFAYSHFIVLAPAPAV